MSEHIRRPLDERGRQLQLLAVRRYNQRQRAKRPPGGRFAPATERFNARIQFDTNGGCWLWAGTVNARGYGCFCLKRADTVAAHRYAFEQAFGSIPPGLFVCHRCDVPICVNPSHLFLGTAADNNRDRARKGRSGNLIPAHIHQEILSGLSIGEPKAAIARRLGVSLNAIFRRAARAS